MNGHSLQESPGFRFEGLVVCLIGERDEGTSNQIDLSFVQASQKILLSSSLHSESRIKTPCENSIHENLIRSP